MATSDGKTDAQVVKIVLLGDSGVGKSSLALRFVTDEFKPYTSTTIGASFMSKTMSVRIDDDTDAESSDQEQPLEKRVAFKIWDTAGQEKYHSLAPMYYRGSAAAVVVYDICKGSTFDTLQSWVEELKSNGPPNIVIVICGNKSDLSEYRKFDAEEAKKYADSIGATFLETSAKDDANVEAIFRDIARRVPSKIDDGVSVFEDQSSVGAQFSLQSEEPAKRTWLGWC